MSGSWNIRTQSIATEHGFLLEELGWSVLAGGRDGLSHGIEVFQFYGCVMWIGSYLLYQCEEVLCLLGSVMVVVWLNSQCMIQNFGTVSMEYLGHCSLLLLGKQHYRVCDSFQVCQWLSCLCGQKFLGRNWVVFWWRVFMLKNEMVLLVECTLFTNLEWVCFNPSFHFKVVFSQKTVTSVWWLN